MAETVSFLIKVSDSGSFKKVEVDAGSLRESIEHVKRQVDDLNGSMVNWSHATQTIDSLQQSLGGLVAVMDGLTRAAATQEVAERQLANNMRNTMDATDAEIASIRELCAAQQQLGVIGDEVQLSGAQELATYLEQKESLEQLIPVMNDMLAQQYGLAASEENAAQIGSMLGKVMEGQTEALSRYGYHFDDAQAQILKFGSESERAAVLAEVVESSVGGMNAALAQTDAGRMKQLSNAIGDVKEKAGALLSAAAPVVTIAAQFLIAAANIGKAVTAVKALCTVFSLASLRSAALALHERVQSVALNLLTSSSWTATAGITALNVATTALYATLTLGLSLAVTALTTALFGLGDAAGEARSDVDALDSTTDTFATTVTQARSELDVETASLKRLIDSHGDATQKVAELNAKYGEAFGYHRTAAEWYDTLTTKSQAYCAQLGYEAQAKVLASQIAAKELERDRNREDGSVNGRLRAVFLDAEIKNIQKEYDQCITRMTDAGREMAAARDAALAAGRVVAIETMTYTELGQAIDDNNQALSGLAPTESAEIQRLRQQNALLEERRHKLGQLLGLERRRGETAPHSVGGTDDALPATPETWTELAQAVSIYEQRLRGTKPAEEEQIQELSRTIGLLREQQFELERQWHGPKGDAELRTLQDIDDEIRWQQLLRQHATLSEAAGINQTIAHLQELRQAFEDAGKAAEQVSEAAVSHVTIAAPTAPTYIEQGSADDKRQSASNARQQAQRIQQDFEIGLTGYDDAQAQLSELNRQLAELGLNPIEIDIKTDDMKRAEKRLAAATDGVKDLGSSLSGLGEAIVAPELNVAGTMAQAIATMVAGYAEATAAAGAGLGPWGWISFGALGLAQLTAMISSVKSLGKFADGGVAYGPTLGLFGEYAGARTNPEVVAPLDKLRSLIGGVGVGDVTFRIKGRYLEGVLAKEHNHRRRS